MNKFLYNFLLLFNFINFHKIIYFIFLMKIRVLVSLNATINSIFYLKNAF